MAPAPRRAPEATLTAVAALEEVGPLEAPAVPVGFPPAVPEPPEPEPEPEPEEPVAEADELVELTTLVALLPTLTVKLVELPKATVCIPLPRPAGTEAAEGWLVTPADWAGWLVTMVG